MLEPFEEERMDIRFASINQTLWNINRDTKRHPTPFGIQQFVLHFGDSKPQAAAKRQQSWKEMKFIGRLIAASFGAQVYTHDGRKVA